ncbi:protein TonB [Breznakibacter xylanolyticus]|uniref:Protein TonB n=1 Tax=Breznakibacter xylanolyticus TaxID=990 RepID=A0A2W7NGX4_9BACT|nr:energy transducer TonB [Breznakibacter xylanolyticus]PZX19488.1 protein TonB [Breznakibacter xylanolyticus]
MEVKKSPQADLERKKSMFLQIGFVVAISAVLIAFDWSTADVSASTLVSDDGSFDDMVLPPITRPMEVTPPPPPAPQLVDVIDIVTDDIPVDDADFDFTSEGGDQAMVDFIHVKVPDEDVDDTSIFIVVEKMPQYPGGDQALKRYLAESVVYPVSARETGISGRVYVSFVVNKKGEVVNVTVARGVHPSLDREALRVVQSMPNWTPGEQLDKKVNVSYTVPINFVLR